MQNSTIDRASRRTILRLAGLAMGGLLMSVAMPQWAMAQADVDAAIEWAKTVLPNSTAEIITAAATEGELVLTLQQFGDDTTTQAMIAKFNEHYPFINVTYTQQNGAQIVKKFTGEISAQRGISDYLMLPSDLVQVNNYIEAGAFAEFVVSEDAQFPDVSKNSGLWYPWLRQTNVTVYRPDALSDEEKQLIRTYGGLGDPRFADRIGILAAATSNGATGTYVILHDAEPGVWEALVANKPIVKPSSGPLIDGLLAGEYEIALMSGYPTAALAAKNGAPIEYVVTTPSPVLYAPGVISAIAPHPNAAKLWQDWAMSKEGQDLWVSLIGVPSARSDVAAPWSEEQPWFFEDREVNKVMDWDAFGAEQPAIVERFQADIQTQG